jgi:hypothetical protein
MTNNKNYIIVHSGEETGIKCLFCDNTSYHPKDVENLYCSFCNIFHRANTETIVPKGAPAITEEIKEVINKIYDNPSKSTTYKKIRKEVENLGEKLNKETGYGFKLITVNDDLPQYKILENFIFQTSLMSDTCSSVIGMSVEKIGNLMVLVYDAKTSSVRLPTYHPQRFELLPFKNIIATALLSGLHMSRMANELDIIRKQDASIAEQIKETMIETEKLVMGKQIITISSDVDVLAHMTVRLQFLFYIVSKYGINKLRQGAWVNYQNTVEWNEFRKDVLPLCIKHREELEHE